jgi:4-amino-4-deoxy-L-arabinose transferase-like glycosyltransferase
VAGNSITSARLAQAALGAITAGLIFLLADRLWSRRVSILALILAVFYPPLVFVDASLLSEPLFALMEVLALLLVIVSWQRRPAWPWLAFAGIACGAALLARPLYPLLLAVMLLAWAPGPARARAWIARPAIVLLGAAAVIAPWTMRNIQVMGALIPISTQTGYVLAGTYNDVSRLDPEHPGEWRVPLGDPRYSAIFADRRQNEVQVEARFRSTAVAFAESHPGYVLDVVLWNAARMLELTGPGNTRAVFAGDYNFGPSPEAEIATWSFIAFALAGAGGLLTAQARSITLRWWTAPLILLAGTVPIQGGARFRVPLDPFVILAAALALAALARRLGHERIISSA